MQEEWALNGKRISIKRKYYVSFLTMIVIPVLCVFLAAIVIVNQMIYSASITNIKSAQESMRHLLENDVKDVSMQLSHIIYIDNGNFMWTAGQMIGDSAAERNQFAERLNNLFQMVAAPKLDIISVKIYLKNGKSVYLKDELRKSDDEIRENDWYCDALDNKNTVTIGTYDTSAVPLMYTRQRKWEFIIAAALSPDRSVDRSDNVEMVTLFYKSDIGDLIKEYEKGIIGNTVITDEKGNVIYQGYSGKEGLWYLKQKEENSREVQKQKVRKYESEHEWEHYTYVTTELEDTGWKIVNMIPSSSLTQRINEIALYMFVVLLLVFTLFFCFSRYFLKNILNPVHMLEEGMLQVQENNLDVHLEPAGLYEIQQMLRSFNRMTDMLKRSIQEKEVAQERKHEEEVRALQSQINPHFLVNALNSIRFMAQVSKYIGIQKMAEALMKIVSCSFRSNISFYSLREEIEVLDSYVYLMKIRYSEGFEVEYQIEEACMECQVPRLILQPLVENAIVHGFSEEETGHLKVSAQKRENKLILKVWDDGCGLTDEKIYQILNGKERDKKDNTSIGMENVFTRLKLSFGESCGIYIRSEIDEYTEIILELPALEENDEKSVDC